MDSRTCIPIFSNGDYTNVIGYNVIKLLGRRDDGYIQFVTEYRLNMVRTYYIKETGQNPDKFEQVETPNDYGFIPVVHIENIAMADTYGGKSDMEDILKINKVFNEMAEDLKMTIDYYAQPTTIITGGTVGQLKRGINQIWSGLPADASVFNLSLNEDMSATMSFLTMLKNAIHDLSGVPEEILSKVQHISNTSASALQMLFQPLIQVADKKSVSYGEGIDALNKLTCIMYAKSIGTHPLFARLPVEALSKPEAFFERYVSEVAWKYNLPNDRMGMLNEANIELTQGIGSRREWMDKLGKANIPSILEEIKADDERKAEMVQAERPAVAGAG